MMTVAVGFSEDNYLRVRFWLLSALEIAPGPFDEAEMLERLRSNDWHLLTTENSACVLQTCIFEGEKIANVLVIGGKRNGSLREIMRAHVILCDHLREQNFTKIMGTPRKEFRRFLIKNGFTEAQEKDELQKELHA
jgi:hypothetical protein